MTPRSPRGPCAPVLPRAPAGPEGPGGPAGPAGPAGPRAPRGPVLPREGMPIEVFRGIEAAQYSTCRDERETMRKCARV